ncbi:MAG TPA: deoxyribonuclease IV [Actinomycetota bacterium]|nr:deoxyribonuclease IV [Actinomycetota bacterium]
MRIGAHVPTHGGLASAVTAAREIGADTIQIFMGNPRAWAGPNPGRKEIIAFAEAWAGSGLGPLWVHAPYLVNVASPNAGFLERSVELARRSVAAASSIGAAGLVIHAGAGGPGAPRASLERAAASLRAIAPEGDCAVLVELMAGTAGAVASTLAEAARLFAAVDDRRLGLCLDTCHLFAVGYGLDEPQGVAACFEELGRVGLAQRLVLVHANDAAFERGSRRDRHEHIGEGHIGPEGFFEILRRPEVRDVSLVVETRGGAEEHARDVAVLRRLAADQSPQTS